VLDGAARHAVAGQAVGVLDVLGNVAGRKVTDGAGVGLDDDAVLEGGAHGAAGAVVDVDVDVVAPADDAVAGGERHRPVDDVGAQRAAGALVGPGGVVQRATDLLATRDQDGLDGAVLGDRGPPVLQRRGESVGVAVDDDAVAVVGPSEVGAGVAGV